MKKTITLLLLVLLFTGIKSNAQSITRIVAASPFQDSLWVFDTTNYNVIRGLGPTPSSGGSLTGTNSVTRNPLSGNLYVVVKQSAVTGRVLGKIDMLTGVVTIIGNLGDNFSSITFSSDGKLYGTTGDGAAVPETLYQIDTATAAIRVVKTLGNGNDGELICYNSTDNMIYHWSGNGTVLYEKFDTITGPYTPVNIPITGATHGETFGMVYRGNGIFIGSNINSRFQLWNANGTLSAEYGASSPDDVRGLAFITCSRAINGATSFCTGSSTTLTHGSSPANNYQWYQNGNLIPGATLQSYVVSVPGHYNCIVNDACGIDSSGTGVNVVENPLPVVTVVGAQSVICPNTSIPIQGNNEAAMQWYMNGAPISGATADIYNATSGGFYNQFVTDANGCSDSASTGFTLTAVPNPVVNLGNDTSICMGDSITLDAGNPGSFYTWSPMGTHTQTETISVSGTYSVTVNNTNGCAAADAFTLTVNPLPVVNLGNDTTVCGSIWLDAENPGATYLWCDGSTTQTVLFPTSGTCAVYVADANGCVGADTITVTVNPIPTVTVSTPNDSLCPAAPSITLTTSPVGGTLTGAGISGNTFNAFNAGPGTHDIEYAYTDGNGCSSADTVSITVFAIVNVSMTPSSASVCVDDANVTLTGTPSGGFFSGTGVSGASFDPAVAGTGTFLVTYMVQDTNGCNFATASSFTVNACVGITEYVSSNDVSLFPNPSDGNVTIALSVASSVMIFNTLGENVMTTTFQAGNHSLDMTAFADGIYFVRTQNAKGVSTQRLVISR